VNVQTAQWVKINAPGDGDDNFGLGSFATELASGKSGHGPLCPRERMSYHTTCSRTNTMPETVTVDGPPVADEAATVSAFNRYVGNLPPIIRL
jgi:hypothetical protein